MFASFWTEKFNNMYSGSFGLVDNIKLLTDDDWVAMLHHDPADEKDEATKIKVSHTAATQANGRLYHVFKDYYHDDVEVLKTLSRCSSHKTRWGVYPNVWSYAHPTERLLEVCVCLFFVCFQKRGAT